MNEQLPRKALVTGGGGFLGRYIVDKLLQRGMEVSILGRSPQPDLEARGVTVIRASLGDEKAVVNAIAGMDVVFHVAAKAGVWGPREEFFEANVTGTRHVLAGCLQHNVRTLIHTSTPSVVFNGEPFSGANESLPYGRNWLCHYAETKAIAEEEVLDAHQPDTLHTVALRPHLIWGPGDPHLIPRVIAKAKAKRLAIVGNGENKVDITYVENAADAHLQAMDNLLSSGTCGGKAYFLSQGEPVSLWPWINDLLARLDIPPVKKQVSYDTARRLGAVAETIWRVFSLKGEPPMTRFVATELAKDHYFDVSAARRDFGYAPSISTEEGLQRLVADLKKKD